MPLPIRVGIVAVGRDTFGHRDLEKRKFFLRGGVWFRQKCYSLLDSDRHEKEKLRKRIFVIGWVAREGGYLPKSHLWPVSWWV